MSSRLPVFALSSLLSSAGAFRKLHKGDAATTAASVNYDDCPRLCLADLNGRSGCCWWSGEDNVCQVCAGGHVEGSAPSDKAARNCRGSSCDGWNWGQWCSGTCTAVGTGDGTGWTPPGQLSLTWADEFSGTTVNTTNWNIGTLRGPNGDIVPGAHGDYNLNTGYSDYIRSEDVWLTGDGTLRLQATRQPIQGASPAKQFNFTSGWVHSMHKIFYTFGYLEARIRFPLGKKAWPAFWTIEERMVWGAEFDIAEYFGDRNIPIWGGKNAALGQHLKTGDYPATAWSEHWNAMCNDPNDAANCAVTDWHVYGLRWTPEFYEYYIDGQMTLRVLKAQVRYEYPTQPMYIVLNNGVRTVADDDGSPFPNYADFDYVRLYQ